MGWTTYHASYYKNGKVDRKAECDDLFAKDCTVLKSTMKGSTYYCALKTPEGDVVAYVVLTCGQDRSNPYFNFGYKAMPEIAIPCYYDCPKTILDLLTPTDNEYANKWRAECRKQLAKPKSWIKELPLGSKIKWTAWDGRQIILTKHAPAYQFKTWFWFDEVNRKYISKKLVNENNAVLIKEV